MSPWGPAALLALRGGPPIDASGFSGTIGADNKQGGSALKPAPFGYAKAKSLDHAIALLAEHADSRLLAGGQKLMATLNMRLRGPAPPIVINALDRLGRISLGRATPEIGPLV